MYVDDLTLSTRGARRYVATTIAAVVDFVTEVFEKQVLLTVSRAKPSVVASKNSLAREIAKRTKSKVLKPSTYAKLLGTAASGSSRRCTKVAKVRTSAFRKNTGRL